MSSLSARNRLLKAGQEVVNSAGYHAAGIDGIVDEAQVAKGTFFYHFGSKNGFEQELLLDFAAQQGDWIKKNAESAAANSSSAGDMFLKFVGLLQTELSDEAILDGCLIARAAYELGEENPSVHRQTGRLFGAVIEAVAEIALPALKEAGASEEAAREVAEGLIATIQGAFVLARAAGDPEIYRRQIGRFAEDVGRKLQSARP